MVLSPSGENSILSPGSIDFVLKKEPLHHQQQNVEPVADFEVKFVSLESKKEEDDQGGDDQEDLVVVAPYKIQENDDNDDSKDVGM